MAWLEALSEYTSDLSHLFSTLDLTPAWGAPNAPRCIFLYCAGSIPCPPGGAQIHPPRYKTRPILVRSPNSQPECVKLVLVLLCFWPVL